MPSLTALTPRFWRAAARLRNRGFEPSIRTVAAGPPLVLSPHMDDAVLSCWSVLRGGDARVVNVFTAEPPQGTLARWDAIAGATDSRERMRERVEEDRAALASAGVVPVNLPFADNQHRGSGRPPSFAELDEALAPAAAGAGTIYAPACLGVRHPDHELVRDYALALAGAGLTVRLYADVPYAADFGWPYWVTGDRRDPNLDIDAFWLRSERRVPPAGERPSAEVVSLDEAERGRKLAAMRSYRTQWTMLDRGPVGFLANPAIHGYEVFWSCGSSS